MNWEMVGAILLGLLVFQILNGLTSRGDGVSEARLARLERKLNLILDHLGVEYDTPFEQKAEVESLLQQRRKIEAIKLYRERTGLGLKEAKDAVEEIEARMKTGRMS